MADVMPGITPNEKRMNVGIDAEDSGSDSIPSINHEAEKRLRRKCDIHIIPVLFVLYILSFLDRINIGNARIQGLEKDLNMKGNQFNVASLIFFVPYILLEIPSNILLKRIKPSAYLSTLVTLWGIITVCTGLTQSYAGLIICRVFLGVFEAGVFPGCIYLIGMYYKRAEFARRWSAFYCSGLVAGAFGGLFAFALAKMDGLGGYGGWRWIYIIEGIITVLFGIASRFLIPDWPEQAKFLTPEERALTKSRLLLDVGGAEMNNLNKHSFKIIITDWKIWTATAMYICVAISSYSTAFFIPTILVKFGYTSVLAQVNTIPIYAVTTVVTLSSAYLSDRLRHRYGFTIAGMALASIGYIMLLEQGGAKGGLPRGVRLLAVYFVVVGVYIVQPITIVWLTNNMGGHYKRAFGAAMQIGLGNIGGIIGSLIYVTKEAPRYPTGYGTAMGTLMFGALLGTGFFLGLRAENKKRDRGERNHRFEQSKELLDNMGDDHPDFRFTL